MISKELLKELHQIIKEDYGVDLTDQIVAHIGNSLLLYFELLLKVEDESKTNAC